MSAPLRPCSVCRKPFPDADCPKHPKKGGYRPDRPSIVGGAYRGAWCRIVRVILRAQPWCDYCTTQLATSGDHVVPHSRGGATTLDNVVGACRRCNTSKGNRTLAEWIQSGRAPASAMKLMKERMKSQLPV